MLHLAVATVVVGLQHFFDAGEVRTLVEVDQRHALGRAPLFPDLRHLGADDHAAGGNQHHLVLLFHQHRADETAVAIARVDRDHALGAAAMASVLGNRRALAEAVLGRGQHGLNFIFGHQHRDHALALFQHHAAHAARHAPGGAHIVFLEAHRLAGIGEQHHVVLAVGDGHADEEIAFVEFGRDDALAARIGKRRQRCLFHRSLRSGHEYVMSVVELFHRQDGGDFLALLQREHVDHGFAAAVAAALRHLVDLDPVHAAAAGKAQHVVVGVGDEQALDEIVFLGRSRLPAASAAALRAVVGERLRLDVARVRQRHHHVGRSDQVFVVEVLGVVLDLALALVAVLQLDRVHLIDDDRGDARRLGEDVEIIGDLQHHLLVFGHDLVLLQAGQALQAHFQDRLRLGVG